MSDETGKGSGAKVKDKKEEVATSDQNETAKIDPAEANKKAHSIIHTNVAISSGIGLVPIPLLDMSALLAQQLLMIRSLGNLYGQSFTDDMGRKALLSLVGSTLPSSSLKFVGFSLLKSIPFVGTTVSMMTMPILSGAMTYAVGKAFNMHFASGGSFLSFDPARHREAVRNEVKAYMANPPEAVKAG